MNRGWRQQLRTLCGAGHRPQAGNASALRFRPGLLLLESRVVPSLMHLSAGEHVFATGAGPGHEPIVNVYDAATGAIVGSFQAYDSHFMGGVNVTVADINQDGVPDIVTGPGSGGGPDVRVFDGASGTIIKEFYAYDPAFAGGVNVAVGSWGDHPAPGMGIASFVVPTIITGAGPGGGPHVKIFDAASLSVLRSFYAYDPHFAGGVRVANGDFDLVTAVGLYLTSDVITASGPGGGPNVRVFNGADGTVFSSAPGSLILSFMAYDPRFSGGVYVASGYLNDGIYTDSGEYFSGQALIITGAGGGGGPDVRIFSPAGALLGEFDAFDSQFAGGVRVAFVQTSNDPNNGFTGDIIAGAGPGGGPHVLLFDAVHGSIDSVSVHSLYGLYAYEASFTGGVYVGGS
jgi:hypothetical protein